MIKFFEKVINNRKALILIIIAFLLLSAGAFAANISNDIVEYTDETCFYINENGVIEGYKDICPKDVVIPTIINNIEVTSIGLAAFTSRELTSVVLPETLQSIQPFAFENNKLTEIVIPGSVTGIHSHAFSYNQLNRVIISESVEYIGNGVFPGNQLTDVYIPESVEFFGENTFSFQFDNRENTSDITAPGHWVLVNSTWQMK